MGLILFLLASSFVCYIIHRFTRKEGFELLCLILTGFLVGSLICVPFVRFTVYASIESFEATRATVEVYRRGHAEGVEDIEKAALSKEVVKENQWLARVQFHRKHPATNIFIPPEVMDLRPIY